MKVLFQKGEGTGGLISDRILDGCAAVTKNSRVDTTIKASCTDIRISTNPIVLRKVERMSLLIRDKNIE